jgi:hypothetical protein
MMGNLTERERLVRRIPEPAPHPDHYLLVFKRSGKDWKLRSACGPGEPYKKPFLDSPDALVAYIVPSDHHLRYRLDRTYKTHDQLHTFKLQLTLEYRVCDPVTLVQKLELDPLHRTVEEIDSFLQQRIKSLDWPAVEHERIDLEQVLFHDRDAADGVPGFTKLQRFADQRGLGIERIAVVRELPEEEIVVQATRLKESREQQTTAFEHETRVLRQDQDLEVEERKNAFDRRTEVATGLTRNVVHVLDREADKGLENLQRAVNKLGAVPGIASMATGALPVGAGPAALPGTPAVALLAGSSPATPLAVILQEVVGSLGGLACDPAERKELLSFGLHVIAEALRGHEASPETLKTYADAITGKFTLLLSVMSQEQVKLLKRLQDPETLKKSLG